MCEIEKSNIAYTAKSGDFEVADSSCQFHGIGHFLEESAISEYIMYIKIRGIGN